jgi:hypothetical protein
MLMIFTVVILSCGKRSRQKSSFKSYSILANISNDVDAKEIFKDFEFITLESCDSCLFGDVSKLIVDDGFFYILDKSSTKKLFIFSTEGKFIRSIGKVGKGPGEYANIEDFTLDKETKNVQILCHPSTVITYSNKGDFISQVRLSSIVFLWNIISHRDGYLCSVNHQVLSESDDAFLLFNFNRDFSLNRKEIHTAKSQIQIPPFISNPLSSIGDTVVYFDSFTNEVYLNVNSEETETIKIDLGKSAVPLDNYADPQNFFSNQGAFSFIVDALVSDRHIVATVADRGQLYLSIIEYKTDRIKTVKLKSWLPSFKYFKDNQIYSSANPSTILEDKGIMFTKSTINYPLHVDGNPVIVKYNLSIAE